MGLVGLNTGFKGRIILVEGSCISAKYFDPTAVSIRFPFQGVPIVYAYSVREHFVNPG